MKIVTFSTLYPNAVQTRHGIFVETRLRHLIQHHPEISSRVIAPIPWFPLSGAIFGEYGKLKRIPQHEERHGITIDHPRYPVIPKIGMSIAPLLMALACLPAFRQLQREGYDFELIDSHYFYPDGVAAILIGRWLNRPVTMTARGTDLNLIPQYTLPRRQIQWAMRHANHMMTVCEALRLQALHLGAEPARITTLRNGVDLKLFTPPTDRAALRQRLSIQGQTILSVGHLIERKGHHLIIDAISKLKEATLLIAGDGELESELRLQVHRLNLHKRVIFLGGLTQLELKEYYGAVDALVLASSREGWANVLLESMACGTPVIATKIWGTPEVVNDSMVGMLVDRTPESLQAAIEKLPKFSQQRSAQIRAYAEQFGWDPTSVGQQIIFEKIVTGQ